MFPTRRRTPSGSEYVTNTHARKTMLTACADALTVVASPAGFEDFVRAFGEPAATDTLPVLDGPPDVERLARIAGEHGITFVGPPGTRPAELAAARA